MNGSQVLSSIKPKNGITWISRDKIKSELVVGLDQA